MCNGEAVLDAAQICTETFGAAPDVIVSSSGAQPVQMPYIPTHLDYMLFELFKNAMRAVVDSCSSRQHLPAIHVAICPAPNSVTLRISDQASLPSPHLSTLLAHLHPFVRGRVTS